MSALNAIQAEIASTQKRKWAFIQYQFDGCEQNYLTLRVCNQFFFSNQQPNFIFDTLSFLLALIHSSIKSYRSVLFAYPLILLKATPVLLPGQLPITLFPEDSLFVVLEPVAIKQSKDADRHFRYLHLCPTCYHTLTLVSSQMPLRHRQDTCGYLTYL